MKRLLLPLLLFVLLIAGPAHAALFTVDHPFISGNPGDNFDLGFSIYNPSDFLVVTGVEIHPSATDPSVVAPTLGTFNDAISAFFLDLGPGVLVAGGPGTFGTFSISPSAPRGSTENFSFWLFYDLYPTDPALDGGDAISYGNFLTADATVEVLGAPGTVPEPSTILLVAGGLLGLVALRHRRRA